jgi:hypothetical protein
MYNAFVSVLTHLLDLRLTRMTDFIRGVWWSRIDALAYGHGRCSQHHDVCERLPRWLSWSCSLGYLPGV